MNLTDNRPKLVDGPGLSSDERAWLRCRQAAELIFEGRYEDAREALSAYWQGVGRRPRLDGLGEAAAAEVLMQCGALNGRFGSAQNVAAVQEAAKDLLSEALRIFETLGRAAKVSEAQYELGVCYWRLGALDEARLLFVESLRGLGEDDSELQAKILIRQTLVEISAHRYHDAWSILKEAEPVFESASDALKGKWHGQRALILLQLSGDAAGGDHADRAIIEFTAAIYHLEQAGHEQFCGASLNNLAVLLYKQGRYAEAHEHLNRARRLFTRLKDSGVIAQVDETRARVLTAEGRYAEAKAVIGGAVRALKEGGAQALLADALVVRGVVEARLGKFNDSIATLNEAIETGEMAGAPESAGHAALTLVEEHGRERLSEDAAYEAYKRADDLLARTQDSEDIARLRACARLVMGRCAGAELHEGFLLPRAVRAYEARFIRKALLLEDGSVSRAAKRLGVKHQSLAHTLRTRHKELSGERTPAIPRRRSIIRVRDARPTAGYASHEPIGPVSILYVEDDRLVADTVKDTLEVEGWRVEVCANGLAGLDRLEGGEPFDLLVFDRDLPGLSGLELAERARRLAHRRDTPVVMLSGAAEDETKARLSGVDVFLSKPFGVASLVETISLLLEGARQA